MLNTYTVTYVYCGSNIYQYQRIQFQKLEIKKTQ